MQLRTDPCPLTGEEVGHEALQDPHRRGRVVAVVASGAFRSAGMKRRTQSLAPEQLGRADSTQTLRVVLRRGETLIVRGPVITGDSLTGLRGKPGATLDSLERVSVLLGAIDRVETPTCDAAGAVVRMVGVRGLRCHYGRHYE